ncbi:MAG: hypothetical protein ACRDQ1_00805, partial [Sciscionella sp.]
MWEPALSGGQDVAELDDDGFYGYETNAWDGCFVAVAVALAEYHDECDALDADGVQRVLALVTDPDTGRSVTLFRPDGVTADTPPGSNAPPGERSPASSPTSSSSPIT